MSRKIFVDAQNFCAVENENKHFFILYLPSLFNCAKIDTQPKFGLSFVALVSEA